MLYVEPSRIDILMVSVFSWGGTWWCCVLRLRVIRGREVETGTFKFFFMGILHAEKMLL